MFTKTSRILLLCCLILSNQLHAVLSNTCSATGCSTTGPTDNFQTLSPLEQLTAWQKVLSDDPSSFSPSDVLQCVTDGVHSIAFATRTLFNEFDGLVKEILPKLSADQQDKVHETFAQYQSMLMTTQTFLERTKLRVKRAVTQEDLVRAIDTEILTRLCDNAKTLLNDFQKLDTLFRTKVKDEKVIRMWGKIAKTATILAVGIILITGAYGAVAGFTPVVKKILVFSLGTMIPTATAGTVAEAAQKLAVFEQVIDNLEEIKMQLAKLSQHFAKINGMQGELRMEDKDQFFQLLNNTQVEIDEGFKILGRF